MAKKHDKFGRSPTNRFIQVFEWVLKTEAWKALDVYERALYIEMKMRFNGSNNGDISMSHREAARILNCSNKPIAAAFAGLQDKGFIRAVQKGSFDWKSRADGTTAGRATRWRLTELPADVPFKCLSGPTQEFKNWRPEKQPEEKQRYAQSTPLVRQEHTIRGNMVCPEHTLDHGVYAHGTR